MLKVHHKGSFKNIEKFFNWVTKKDLKADLNDIGRIGAESLAKNTPVDTGLTASSWEYEVVKTSKGYRINWSNTNVQDGVLIAILIQYGHATGTGGWVAARDYINPVMLPLFGKATEDFWEEVTNA